MFQNQLTCMVLISFSSHILPHEGYALLCSTGNILYAYKSNPEYSKDEGIVACYS